jgi:hypothetical protein
MTAYVSLCHLTNPHFLPALDPMSIAGYALHHTSAYQILKQSTMFAKKVLCVDSSIAKFYLVIF